MVTTKSVPAPSLIPDQCIAFNIGKAYRNMLHYFEKAFTEKSSISSMQYGLLIHIAKLEPVSGREISAATGHDPSTLSRTLGGLEKAGLVSSRRDDGGDRRRVLYTLTAAGRKGLDAAVPIWSEVHRRIIQELGLEESGELLRILRRVQTLDLTQAP